MKHALLIGAAVAAAALMFSSVAESAVTIVGRGPAQDCYKAADSDRRDRGSLALCALALDHQLLTDRDRAATLVNRAIILMRRNANALALHDLERAAQVDPLLAEAHVMRGAVLVEMGRAREAIAGLTQALAMNPANPERVYYYRATAHEELGDMRAAYADYQRAAEIAPDWQAPQHELTRFRIG